MKVTQWKRKKKHTKLQEKPKNQQIESDEAAAAGIKHEMKESQAQSMIYFFPLSKHIVVSPKSVANAIAQRQRWLSMLDYNRHMPTENNHETNAQNILFPKRVYFGCC